MGLTVLFDVVNYIQHIENQCDNFFFLNSNRATGAEKMLLEMNENKQRKVVPETEYDDILIWIVQFRMENKN